jgi:hypothetical protein
MASKKKAIALNEGDAWNRNDEKLYGIMGGKNKTKYLEDGATYREFGRTYGGPTDALGVAGRKRREAGDFSFGEKSNKRMTNKKAGPSETSRMRKRADSLKGIKSGYVGKNVKRGAK